MRDSFGKRIKNECHSVFEPFSFIPFSYYYYFHLLLDIEKQKGNKKGRKKETRGQYEYHRIL